MGLDLGGQIAASSLSSIPGARSKIRCRARPSAERSGCRMLVLSLQSIFRRQPGPCALSPAPPDPHARIRNLARAVAKRLGEPSEHLASIGSFFANVHGLTAQSCGPAWDRQSAPCRRCAARRAIYARNRHLPPSPPCPSAFAKSGRTASGALGGCSGKSAAIELANAGIHLVLGYTTRRQRDCSCAIIQFLLLVVRLEALSTVRVEEDAELSLVGFYQALPPWGVTGSVPASASLRQPPARSFCRLGTQGAFRDRHGRGSGMR